MSKRPGAVSADTREAVLSAAREAFYKHGFQGTSLRQVSAAAGVTTGAIYFFFTGKDELFEAVLAQATEPFLSCMRQHYQSEHDFLSRRPEENQGADLAVSRTLIDCYFRSQKTWDILLNHLSQPAVRQFLDDFIRESADHYGFLLKLAGKELVDDFAVHQFAHMQADTMLTLISHGFTREEMIRHSMVVTRMLRAAFQSLLEE